MRKLILGVLAVGGLLAGGGRAQAWQWGHTGPYASSATFPLANPPGWFTNTYSFAWYYPWFAYYNYSHGPYANWMSGGGYATYSTYTGHPVMYRPYLNAGQAAAGAAGVPVATGPGATITVAVPADARLLFNGVAATGTGLTRTFTTAGLQPGVDYAYDMTAERVVDGKTVTVVKKRVVIRSGDKTVVDLLPPPK